MNIWKNRAKHSGLEIFYMKHISTEKSVIARANNKLIFQVPLECTKENLMKLTEIQLGTKPLKINIIIRKGKVTNFRQKRGVRSNIKLAIITMPQSFEISEPTEIEE